MIDDLCEGSEAKAPALPMQRDRRSVAAVPEQDRRDITQPDAAYPAFYWWQPDAAYPWPLVACSGAYLFSCAAQGLLSGVPPLSAEDRRNIAAT